MIYNHNITNQIMEEKYKKFYKMFDKRFKNLILCSKTLNHSGVVSFAK